MIFPSLENEEVVQVNDRTRLSGFKSFVTQDEGVISLVEIDPDGSQGLITVTTDKFLDWQYSASGEFTVTCRVTNSGGSAQFTSAISVLTEASDGLFSTDQDLKTNEPDILKWVEAGRNTFKNMHRRAQELMMDYLRREGFRDVNGAAFTKTAIVNTEEVRQWSTFLTLRLIFSGLSNGIDDVFLDKSKGYKGQEVAWRKNVLLQLDTDGDGVVDTQEGIDTAYAHVARR